jgi:uncharacterized protein
MKQVIETIVKAIVDLEKRVVVNEVVGGNSVIIEILVDKSDLGKTIGKQGKTASAIRSIVYAASFKTKRRYTIEINAHPEK